MSTAEIKKFQNGEQVFKKYIPGFASQDIERSFGGLPIKHRSSVKEIIASIIRPFTEEMSKISRRNMGEIHHKE